MQDSIIAISICSMIVLSVFCFKSCVETNVADDNRAITEMVKNGADPVLAKCAIKGDSTSYQCAVAQLKSKADSAGGGE